MARPLTKFGELKKVIQATKLPKKEVDQILSYTIEEFERRTPTSPEVQWWLIREILVLTSSF